MGINATDRERSIFLKGLNFSKSSQNEDPTYLGFKIVFDFGTLPINPDYGWAPSPLLRVPNYISTDMGNPFGQPAYNDKIGAAMYYSTYNYLRERESDHGAGAGKRSNAIRQFQQTLADINKNSPWFFQSIAGLNDLVITPRTGFQTELGMDDVNAARSGVLTFSCLESINLRVSALADLYNNATYDFDNMRWTVPRNLRKFTMWIFVTEIRNFFKTSRLSRASSVVSSIDDLSSLLTTDRNPGTNIDRGLQGDYLNSGSAGRKDAPGASFESFASKIFQGSGLSDDYQSLMDQQDQMGIKPVLVIECSQCEFDFSSSTPIQDSIDVGVTPSVTNQSFKIHVGKVRRKSQYPNIRQDGKPLVIADGWDQYRSSYQTYGDDLSLTSLLSMGDELLTNMVSNAINDLVNEGVSSLGGSIDEKAADLGNSYSFNPSQKFSFNSAQDLLNTAGDLTIGRSFGGGGPSPQDVGQGGPPERVYPPIDQDKDVYLNNPGSDLGGPDRIYPKPSGETDVYPTNPGEDLGVPGRVYPKVEDDVYPTNPGPDLGVPDRIYPTIEDDVYPTNPGPDGGVPDRIYPDIQDDVYPTNPGEDLGVPNRVYPGLNEDVYPTNPGEDLGVPDRRYPTINDSVYTTPDFVSSLETSSVYPDNQTVNFNGEIRTPGSVFEQGPERVYETPTPVRGPITLGDVYPETNGDFIVSPPLNLGNAKPDDKYNISLGTLNSPSPDQTPGV